MPLIHMETKQILAQTIYKAHHFLKRAKGLIGAAELKDTETLWIRPCSCIHTFFMNFPIDVIFVDKNLKIQSYHNNVPPFRMLTSCAKVLHPMYWFFHISTYDLRNYFKTHSVFEFKAGALSKYNLKRGDQIYVGN